MSKTRSYFDLKAANYGLFNPFLKLVRWFESRQILKMLPNLKGQKVLEIGCGSGFYTTALMEAGAGKLVVNDLSEEMLKHLRHWNVERWAGDYMQLKIPSQSFDQVICLGASEFMPSYSQFLKKALSEVRSCGGVAFLVPARGVCSFLYQCWYSRRNIRIQSLSRGELESLLFHLQLKNVEIARIWPMNWMVCIQNG